jgi:hypothetical protein
LDLDLVYKIYLEKASLRDSLNVQLMAYSQTIFSQNNGTIDVNTLDDYYSMQWGLNDSLDHDIDAPEAWNKEHGEANRTIAIIDKGVCFSHPDLWPKVSGDDWDSIYHGTAVAGVAAAVTNNGIGVAGVNWNAHIYSRNTDGADFTEIYNIIMEVCTHPEICVFNCSWVLKPDVDNVLIHKAFAYAYSCGFTPVVARNNCSGWPNCQGNSTPSYPSCFGDWIISVGALAWDGSIAGYSHYGSQMDFLAPGGSGEEESEHDIYTTFPPSDYFPVAGTSFAAPFVTGIISLIQDYANYNDWTAEDYERLLQISCTNLNQPGYDEESGWGLVKAGAALDSLTANYIYLGNESQSIPYVYQTFPEETMTCYGWYGLSGDGNYRVVRKEIRSDVNYEEDDNLPERFCSVHVWGWPLTTSGYAYEGSINYAIPFCEVVPGTETLDGCTIRTYVYDIWSMDHNTFYGELPTNHTNGRHLFYTTLFKTACSEPWNLGVEASQNDHPLVSWRESLFGDIETYKIYRKVNDVDEDFVHIADVPSSTLEYEDQEYYIYSPPPLLLAKASHLSLSSPNGDTPLPLLEKNAEYIVTAYDGCRESIMPPSVSIDIEVPCEYVVGDVNGSGTCNGTDVSYCVAYFHGGGDPPVYECECTPNDTWYVAGDVNNSCTFNGLDVTYMVAFFKGGPALVPCAECPPGGFHLLSEEGNGDSFETIQTIETENSSSILINASRSDSIRTGIIADLYLTSDDSVAFINIPLQWQPSNITADNFQPSLAISGWEDVHTTFGEGQFLFSAWNDLGPNRFGNENPIVSNSQPIHLGRFLFSVKDTSDFRNFDLNLFDDPRIGLIMLGHPNGRSFSQPSLSFVFSDHINNPKEEGEQIPLDYSSIQNYPNPFNTETVFKYTMPQDSHVSLEIFDMLGRRIAVLVDETQSAGYHQVTWDAGDQVSGTYFYNIKIGDFAKKGSMTLLK